MAATRKLCPSLLVAVLLVILINNSRGQDSYIVYTNGATSERSLPICNNPRTACNIIHKRFWLTPLVKRLCKCPDRMECPQTWTTDSDKNTITLNGRAQMKFCGRVRSLPNCNVIEIAAAAIESYNSTNNGPVHNVEVNCYCPMWHYFNKLHTDMSRNNEGNMVHKDYYGCQRIHVCTGGEFCGHITTDFYETYYRCSCPKQHVCVMNNRHTTYTTEIMYEGLAYKGMCTSYES